MFLALFWTIIASFSDVFWKKSLSFGVRPFAHNLASYPIGFLFFLYFMIVWVDISNIDTLIVVLISVIIISNILKQPVIQQIYREEKISIIMPYTNLNKIFVIIASFFLFQDVSVTSFIIILFTIGVIVLASIDFKNKRLPRNFWKILLSEFLTSFDILLGGWLVLNYGELSYFNVSFVIWVILYLCVVTISHQAIDIRNAPKAYWQVRLIGALWWVAWFLSLVVIKNLWISLSILLWFLWIGITLLISYFILWDTPSKKNIGLTIIVSLLIWIWYYFK